MRHLLILAMLAAAPAQAATPTPDWPCVQPRQPHLSLGQVWTGPPPPETAAETPEIAALAERLAQRRMPIEEATTVLDAFAEGRDADTLALLCRAECARKDERRIQMHMGIARFPAVRTLESFDFDAQPAVDPKQIRELATGRWIANGDALLLLGPPGVGKSQVSIAGGVGAEG